MVREGFIEVMTSIRSCREYWSEEAGELWELPRGTELGEGDFKGTFRNFFCVLYKLTPTSVFP